MIEELSSSLGNALQITNILRDVKEDALSNRLYIPREFLQKPKLPLPTRGLSLPTRTWLSPAKSWLKLPMKTSKNLTN